MPGESFQLTAPAGIVATAPLTLTGTSNTTELTITMAAGQTANPLTVQDSGLNVLFEVQSTGSIRFSADGNAVLSRPAASAIKASQNFEVNNVLGVGAAFDRTAPGGIVDIRTSAGTDASVRVLAGSNGNAFFKALNASAEVRLWTTNASVLTVGTNNAERARFPTTGGFVLGTGALATTATDGFLYVPSSAGAPTGVPTTQNAAVPMQFDTTNVRLYAYIGGAWKLVALV